MIKLIQILIMKNRLRKLLRESDSMIMYDKKHLKDKVRFQGLEAYDRNVKKQMLYAIREYSSFSNALREKLAWSIKDWYKIDLILFNKELEKALDKLKNEVDRKVEDAFDAIYEEGVKRGLVKNDCN